MGWGPGSGGEVGGRFGGASRCRYLMVLITGQLIKEF